MSFRANLSATGVAAIAGMALQAATAPAYLRFLPVEIFSTWVYVSAIAAYFSLFANGAFYSLLNEITLSAHRGDRATAGRIYTDGFHLVLGIITIACIGLVASTAMYQRSVASCIWAALLLAGINLSSVLFDANFRSCSRFVYGTNLLSGTRVFDWFMTLCIVAATRDVYTSLVLTSVYRIAVSSAVHVFLSQQPDALLVEKRAPETARLAGHVWNARGQLWLSATSAGVSMGPQIVVGALFPGIITVSFNVYRTYLRLLASGASIGIAAAWPLMNRWFAEGQFSLLNQFLKRSLVAGFLLSTGGAVVLTFLARPVFRMLFPDTIQIHLEWFVLIAPSVVATIITSISQSFFLSTNVRTRDLPIAALIACGSLLLSYFVGRAFGFNAALAAQVAGDVLLASWCGLAAIGLLAARMSPHIEVQHSQ